MATMRPPFIVPAVKKHTATVIFVHGLGDTGMGWMDVAKNWRRRGIHEHIKFIFPNAPSIPITVNFGTSMPGWYDIKAFDDLAGKSDDEPGITRSRDYFNNLIKTEQEETGVPPQRMILGGFSQGGAISLFTSLTTTHQLSGFFGLSSYLLLGSKLPSLIPSGNPNANAPVFMGHGEADPLVRYEWGQKTASVLKEMGRKVEFHSYPGLVHSASEDEVGDLERWIAERLPEGEGGVAAAEGSKA